jgi:outer membrane protein TolC
MVERRLVSALLFCFTLWPQGARAEAPLDLEEAVKLALANNERALSAPLRVEAAQGQLERARSAFLPTLVAGATASLRPPDGATNRALSSNGTLTLSQPLLNPSAFPLYAQARHQLESERWGAAQDIRLVAFDTARAFLVVLTTERVFDAATRRLEHARADQQNAEARAAAQLASTNDVTRSLIETASAAREVAQARGNVTRAYLELGFLVGKPVTGPLAAPTRTTRAAERGGLRTEEIIRSAEARRPDVLSAHERTEALRAGAEEPLYRLAPTVSASAQVRVTVAPLPTERLHDESAQLTLSWTLYDAGARYADRKTRRAQADSQALDERQLRRSIATDIGVAGASLRAARESYRIAEETVAASRQNSAETEVLYQQGLARAIELIDANARLYDAEVSQATAKLAMEQAYLELRLALGLGPLSTDAESAASPPAGAQ